MSKWKCNNKDCYCGCVIDMNSPYVPNVCPAFNAYKKADWHPVDELVTNCNQLPKLTAEVFDRPEKKKTLPDWCKVGEWVYFAKDDGGGYYTMVLGFDGEEVFGECPDRVKSYCTHLEKLRQARLRPFNAEEMKALVGKVIEKGPSIHMVTGFENVLDSECMVHVNGYLYNANDILRQFTINNSLCGVLEHLENGEWVE